MALSNVDGSLRGNLGLVGFGGLIWGDDGHWIVGFYGFIGVVGSLLPKLLAVCHELRLAWDRDFRQVLCESDSLDVIRLIHLDAVDYHHFQAVVMDIQY